MKFLNSFSSLFVVYPYVLCSAQLTIDENVALGNAATTFSLVAGGDQCTGTDNSQNHLVQYTGGTVGESYNCAGTFTATANTAAFYIYYGSGTAPMNCNDMYSGPDASSGGFTSSFTFNFGPLTGNGAFQVCMCDTAGAVMTNMAITCGPIPTPAPTPAPVTPTAPTTAGGSSTPSPSAAPTCECFSESATVQVQHQEDPVAMKDLQVGQKVFAGMGEDNQPRFESVYGFAHHDQETIAKYLRITTTTLNGMRSSLEMTPNHLIFVQGQKDPVPSGSLKVGDILISNSLAQTKDADTSARITDIQTIFRKGLYAPLTQDGTVIVDGIIASSYVSIKPLVPRVMDKVTQHFMSEHAFFHWWMAPYRVFCMGVAPEMCQDDYSEQDGYIYWLVLGRKLAEVAQRSSTLVMVAGLFGVLSFCGVFVLLENISERPILWFLLQVICGLLFCWRKGSFGRSTFKQSKEKLA